MAEARRVRRATRSGPVAAGVRRTPRKTKIALRIPPPLGEEMAQAMARDGYSRKRQSLWIEEALTALARRDPDMSQSLVGDRTQGPNSRQVIVALPAETLETLKDLIIRLRLQVPTIEGVQSLVLRGAMRFRIRNPRYFQSWNDRGNR